MSYDKEKYKILKQFGYSAKEADVFARTGKTKFKTLVEDKIMSAIDSGEKLPQKFKRDAARFFGFLPKEADRMRNFTNKNLLETIQTKALPEVKELYAARSKNDIKFVKAISKNILLHDARYAGNKITYIYRVKYTVMSEVVFFRDTKYVTISSDHKLSKKEVFQKVLDVSFAGYDETYNTVPDPTSLEIVEAYYMTNSQYKELEKKRESDRKNGGKNSTHNNKGKK